MAIFKSKTNKANYVTQFLRKFLFVWAPEEKKTVAL